MPSGPDRYLRIKVLSSLWCLFPFQYNCRCNTAGSTSSQYIYTIWWAYFTITLWSPDLCKAVILDVGWSTIQSQFLRKPYLRLTDSHRSVILIVFYFISLGRVIEMWICWHYELWFMFVYRQHCDLCCAMGIWWFVLWPQITNQRPCTDTWVHPQIHYKYTWYICIYIHSKWDSGTPLEASRMLTVDSKFDSKTPKSFWGKIDWSQTVALWLLWSSIILGRVLGTSCCRGSPDSGL